jgi:trimeric autotransporter adhesin
MKQKLSVITALFIVGAFLFVCTSSAIPPMPSSSGTPYDGTGVANITTTNIVATGGNITGLTNLGVTTGTFANANITDTLTANVLKTSGTQVMFLPNQTTYTGTFIVGNGGAAINADGETEATFYNTFVGIGAGSNSTIAKKNTFVGYKAGNSATSGWANTFVGYGAGMSGIGTGNLTVSGNGGEFYANTFVGSTAGASATTASFNTFVGVDSGLADVDGHNNVYIGVHAGNSNQHGDENVFIGRNAGYAMQGNYSVIIGKNAGFTRSNTAGAITAIGYQAGYADENAGYNTYIGYQAGLYNAAGYSNVFVGTKSGYGTSTKGSYMNACVGDESCYAFSTDAEGNSVIGYRAGYNITTGTKNTFIGRESGYNASQKVNAVNSMGLGYQTYTTENNQVVIGNPSITETILRKPKVAGTSGGLKTIPYEVLSGLMTGGSVTIAMGVPANARLKAIQMKVKDAVTSDSGTTWSATLAGGSTTSIGTGLAFAVNTVANVMLAGNEISTAGCNIVLTPNEGNFTAGNIQAIVYTEELTSMLISNP